MRLNMLSLAIGLLAAGRLFAADAPCGPVGCDCVESKGSPGCCCHCGQHCGCDAYCKVVPYVKEVKKHVWKVHCEDFCPSLPGCPLGGCCDDSNCPCVEKAGAAGGGESGCCPKCGCLGGCHCDVCAVELDKRQTPPKCGCVHTRKILEMKEVICKVPSYKCVVCYTCPQCGNVGGTLTPVPQQAEPKPAVAPPAAAPVPPPPGPAKMLPPPPRGF